MSMRLRSALALCLFAAAAFAQETPAAFLKRSLAAYGATAQVRTVAYTVEGRASNRWQARDPKAPEALPTKATLVLRLDRGDFRSETEQRFPGGYLFHFVTVAEGATARTYDVPGSRVGKALFTLDAETRAQEFHQGTERLPFWTLRGLLAEAEQDAAPFSLHREGDLVRLAKAGKPAVDFVFDAGTSRLVRIESTLTTSTGDEAQRVLAFDRERAFEGLWQPTRIRTTLRGAITAAETTETLKAFTLHAEATGATWQVPADRVAPPEGTALEVERLSDTFLNVYDPDSGRNLPFLRVGRELVAFDAPLAPGFCDHVLEAVRKVWPDTRVAWVVLTHFHNDHVAGLPAYVRAGARVACSATARPMLESMLRLQGVPFDDATFHLPARARVPGLDLYEVPNRHVKGMVLAHLPGEGLIYEGDLLSLPVDGTLTAPLPVTRDLFAFLKAHPLAYTRMIGHHGNGRITPALLQALEGTRP
jgi:glyoxylase-like metal-dependent hydrolase (beta-lactamase superfamily II)